MKRRVLLAKVTLQGANAASGNLTDTRLRAERVRFHNQLFALAPALREPCFAKLQITLEIDPRARLSFQLWLEPQIPRRQAIPDEQDPFDEEVERIRSEVEALQDELDALRMAVTMDAAGADRVGLPVYDLFFQRTRQAWLLETDSGQSRLELPERKIVIDAEPRVLTGVVRGTDERRIDLGRVSFQDDSGRAVLLKELKLAAPGSCCRVGQLVRAEAKLHRELYTSRYFAATAVGIPSVLKG